MPPHEHRDTRKTSMPPPPSCDVRALRYSSRSSGTVPVHHDVCPPIAHRCRKRLPTGSAGGNQQSSCRRSSAHPRACLTYRFRLRSDPPLPASFRRRTGIVRELERHGLDLVVVADGGARFGPRFAVGATCHASAKRATPSATGQREAWSRTHTDAARARSRVARRPRTPDGLTTFRPRLIISIRYSPLRGAQIHPASRPSVRPRPKPAAGGPCQGGIQNYHRRQF